MDRCRVFIITEATEATGWGHIGRCTAIYEAFREKGMTPVFIVNGGEIAAQLLEGKPFELFDWTLDTERLLKLIDNSDIAVVDSYIAKFEHYDLISRKVKSPVYIDDNVRLTYPKGTVVNGTIFAEDLPYSFSSDVKFRLGSPYILLRKDFWTITPKVILPEIQDVLVTFGGSDIRNLTPTVLRVLCDTFPKWTKHIVIGSDLTNQDDIYSELDKKTTIYKSLSALEMKSLMMKCDLAISAAGQTMNELARCGLPTVAVMVISNQIDNIRGWMKSGFISGYIDSENFQSVDLLSKISSLKDAEVRKRLSAIGQQNVDGKGARRIASSAFIPLIELSPALSTDLLPLLDLANDPVVRSNSFSSIAISLEEHRQWFERVRNSKNTLLLVARLSGVLLGQVRFDKKVEGIVTSISMTSTFRGWGLGNTLLQKSLNRLQTEWSDIHYVIAYVKKTNIASRRIFEKGGYKFIEEKDGVCEYRYCYV
ncbi:MAG: GNAT family N-acetyltransferase [Bacteroidales bacterium]